MAMKRNTSEKQLASLMDCLSAGYQLQPETKDWVRGLVQAATPALDDGLGVLGYTYDASDPRNPTITSFATSERFDPRWLGPFNKEVQSASGTTSLHPAGFDAWRGVTCGQASQVAGMKNIVPLFAHLGGAKDSFAINARDTSGKGLWLGGPMRSTSPVSARRIEVFTRLAAHLSSAMRLRVPATPPTPAAVMAPGGKLLHAEDPVAAAERDHLREATLAFDSARTQKMRDDVSEATRRWRPLVESRWSLLDEFDSDGRRFVIAVQNAPPTAGNAPRQLSEREVQVLSHAQLGHTNKVIAYELGLAASTVRVLLHRAARKLGASTREEAVERFEGLVEKPPQMH